MKTRFGPSIYFASDKVVFDALNQAKVTTELVRELFFDRGTIVSAKTPKYELAQYFSRLTADYFDHQEIAQKLGKVATRERVTSTDLEVSLQVPEIVEALSAVKAKLEAKENRVQLSVDGGRVTALIEYEYVDYTEVEFRQVQPRDAVIEFVPDEAGNYVVRNTQNSFADDVVAEVVAALNAERDTAINPRKIILTGYPDPVKRTEFFTKLLASIDGYQAVTVTEAYCYKAKASAFGDDEDPDRPLEESPHVERVTLKGSGVTKSFVYDGLYERGYYIVKVVWQVRSTSSIDADLYELEVQFSEPKECTNLSYQARAVLICEEGKFTGKKRSPKKPEQDEFARLIEKASKIAFASLEG